MASSTRVFHFRRLSCIRAQKASTIALSSGAPTALTEGARPGPLQVDVAVNGQPLGSVDYDELSPCLSTTRLPGPPP